MGDEARGRGHAQRQSHQLAAQHKRRRRGRPALCVFARLEFTVWHGAGGRPAVCRGVGRGAALPLPNRRHANHRKRIEGDGLAGRQHQPPLDKKPHCQSRRPQTLCDGGFQQQRRRTRHGGRNRPCCDLGNRPGQRAKPLVRQRPSQPQRHGLGTGQRRAVDGGERARRAGQRLGARLHDFRQTRCLLRLALQLLRPKRRRSGSAAAARFGGQCVGT